MAALEKSPFYSLIRHFVMKKNEVVILAILALHHKRFCKNFKACSLSKMAE